MGHGSEFDIKLQEGEFTERKLAEIFASRKIEVKSDRACRRTQNICIEYCQNDPLNGGKKKSGILITEAKYWAIEFYDDAFLLVNTEQLKRCASDYAKDHPDAKKNCGDNGNRGVIIPITELVLRLLRS